MTRVLLFGASGFLGRQVHAQLVLAGVRVVTSARTGEVVDVPVDLSEADPHPLAELLRAVRADVVVNCAGATAGSATELVTGNVVTVATLLDAVRRTGAAGSPPRLVHIGSAAEYGVVPAGKPVPEFTAAHPVGAYGVSKLAGTALVLAAARQGLPTVVLRVFEPFGPGTPADLLPGRLVAEYRRSADGGDPVRVDALDAYRDFVDVRDVAAAVVAAATAPMPVPPLLNVGSGRATPVRELARAVAAVAGGRPAAVTADADGSARSAEVPWQQADLTTITAALDWQPEMEFAESVADMWRGDPADWRRN